MLTFRDPTINSRFDVSAFLQFREGARVYSVVEIGHGICPILFNDMNFQGERHYFGVESWLRDSEGAKRKRLVTELALFGQPPNAHFLLHDPGVEVIQDPEAMQEEKSASWLSGDYNAKTSLQDSMANEVFMGNVLGDPHIAYNSNAKTALAKEAGRLLKVGGCLVVRETLTPQRVEKNVISQAGASLALVHITEFESEPDDFQRLERVYGNSDDFEVAAKGSFYGFWEKQD